ncbi:MAG: hypothetical protein FJ297_12945 [Planctomycetes bacterium]|nr:hypothetical protein [Planctomycetota bacterium]
MSAWLIGVAIFALLFVLPEVGLAALWNTLIPVAPALIVFAPGVWRNVCPLGTTAVAARHAGLSARRSLSPLSRVWLNFAGVVALFVIVLWRRFELNTNAQSTAAVLAALGALSIAMGAVFEWKSGWCSGLCPVHGVEKLYGSKPLIAVDNAHCDACERCTNPCPDSTDAIHPMLGTSCFPQIASEWLLVGAFPGFVWGWFHVPDHVGGWEWSSALSDSTPVLLGASATLAAFIGIRRLVPKRHEGRLVRVFAAATVSCYYWYRIPALFGCGPFPTDGTLIDLSAVLPDGWIGLSRAVTTTIFVGWIVFYPASKRHWLHRPPYASGTISGSSDWESGFTESGDPSANRFSQASPLVQLDVAATDRATEWPSANGHGERTRTFHSEPRGAPSRASRGNGRSLHSVPKDSADR